MHLETSLNGLRISDMTERCTVLISGAGPVGTFLALRLAQANISVIVLEAQEKLEDEARAMTHMPSVFEEFKRAGVYDDLFAAAGTLKNTGVCFRKTTDKSIIAKMPQMPGRPGPFIVPQYIFCRILAEHLKNFEHARLLLGHRLQAVDTSSDDKVTVTARTTDGIEKTFEASFLVAADGSKSVVRNMCGIKFEGETLPRQLVATDIYYPFDKFGWSGGNFMADPEHYGLIGPITSEGLWRVSYAVPDNVSLPEIKDGIPEKFNAMFPGPRPLEYKIDKVAPYKAQQLCASTLRKGRAILVGDAAHLTNPYAGMGLGTGILDASSLADVLTSHIHRGAPDGLLDAWAQARRNVFKKIVDPISRASFWTLQDPDVDSLPDRQPMLKAMKAGPGAKPPSLATDVTQLEGYVPA